MIYRQRNKAKQNRLEILWSILYPDMLIYFHILLYLFMFEPSSLIGPGLMYCFSSVILHDCVHDPFQNIYQYNSRVIWWYVNYLLAGYMNDSCLLFWIYLMNCSGYMNDSCRLFWRCSSGSLMGWGCMDNSHMLFGCFDELIWGYVKDSYV